MIKLVTASLYLLYGSTNGLSSSSTTTTTTTPSFWTSSSQVSQLPDPPPPELLTRIQAQPYLGGFEPAIDTADRYHPDIVYGTIPRDLVGSLATNGPGRIRIGARQYGHWFDGDGYVTHLSLDGRSASATFQAKYVRTERYVKQEALLQALNEREDNAKRNPPLASAGAWTKKGQGHWFENLATSPTNPANTATLWLPATGGSNDSNHGDNDKHGRPHPRLLAVCEGGQPIELDPYTLATIGDETSFFGHGSDGDATTIPPPLTTPDSFFSAHFSRCPETGDIYNHGYKLNPGPGPKEINILQLSSNGRLVRQRSAVMPFDTFVHDSVLSQNHLVYFTPPWKVPEGSLWKFLTGQSPFGKLYVWDADDVTSLRVHSKKDLSLEWTIPLPEPMSEYHLLDAHETEQEDGGLLLRVRVAESDPLDRARLEAQFSDMYRVEGDRMLTRMRDYSFALHKDRSFEFLGKQDVASNAAPCEFPISNTAFEPTSQRRQYCWTNALSDPSIPYLDGLQKIDTKAKTALPVLTFGDGSFCGAPVFVAKEKAKREDDGYLIATVYRSLEHRSDVVIVDASRMKLLCTLQLKQHVPYQFHGEYLSGFTV